MGDLKEHASEYSKWIQHILKADSLEGSNGLYYRLAQTARHLTGAEHVVVLVPDLEVLKVVGCAGDATNIALEFPKSTGIIGRIYQKAVKDQLTTYELIRDVCKDPDYVTCDPHVCSELVVCIIEDHEVELIINAESRQEDYFTSDHASLIVAIVNVAAEYKRRVSRLLRLTHEAQELRVHNERFYKLLKQMPDEIMIIDRSFHPVFSNQVKMNLFPNLAELLRDPEHQLEAFLSGSGQVVTDHGPECYRILEGRSHRCERCVCFRAMQALKPIQGIVYKPSFEAFVEISAAPVLLDGKVIGCIEITRSVKQRERVLENISSFFECVSERNLLDRIIEILQGPLGYKRVRLYSVDIDAKQLKGERCSSGHPKVQDFTEFSFAVLTELEDGLLRLEKAGLVTTDEAIQSEQSHGYWQVFIPSDKLVQYVDPHGLLGLEGVDEFIVVPIITDKKRLVFCVDNEGQQIRFNSDDLQALTILARFSSLSLGMLEKNELRFKLAVAGETALGLHHMCYRYFALKSAESFTYSLARLYKLGVKYLETPDQKDQNEVLMQYLHMIIGIAIEPHVRIPFAGDMVRANKPLEEKLRRMQLILPSDDTLEDIMCLVSASDRKHAFKILSETLGRAGDNPAMWEFICGALHVVRVLKKQEQLEWGLDVLGFALKEIARSDVGDKIVEFEIKRLLNVVVDVVSTTTGFRGITGHDSLQPFNVHGKLGTLFLAFQALLKNAVDAAGTPTNKPMVAIETGRQRQKSKNVIEIRISNNGDHIPEKYVDRIGKTRIPNPRSKGHTGLGLIFAHDWIESSRGELRHKYDGAEGITTFSVTLEASTSQKTS